MTSVAVGRRLGPYEVLSRVGSGGMGEVFRARDTRLDRTVAIKILPAEFADNVELKTRFEREARAISRISHPHICALHDVGRADGVEYLVLEFIEGETLTERIARGPLPIADVLRLGAQIASALACAHRAGIVHRDLKPGNVMITTSGAKLLDFGIARSAAASAPPADEQATRQGPLTQAGTILGTFQYMSPEQLSGEDVDERTDVFALGAVLYEMLTGVRAFEAASRTGLVAAVLAGSPRPASSLRPATPPALDHVIAKCLATERDDRWQNAADIASELKWIGGSSTAGSAAVGLEKPPRRTAVLFTLAVAVAAIAGALAGGLYLMPRVRLAEQPVRSELLIDEPLTPVLFGTVALSSDGTKLLLLVGPPGKPSIAIRNFVTGETKKLLGTEGANFPFWSPDSQQVAFFAGGKLKTIGATGGSVQTVCDAKQGRGGSWSGGVIVFAPDLGSPIFKVGESGGTPVPLTHPGPNEPHRQPVFLPDGKRFLYSARIGDGDVLYAGSVDGTLQKRIVENTSNAAFARGRLFFVRDGNLVSQPFDPANLELSGTPAPIADHVEYFKVRSTGNFSVIDTKMVYVSEASGLSRLVAHDRSGRSSEIPVDAADYRIIDISPDDRTLAVAASEHFEVGDVWLVQLEGGTKSRLTFARAGALSGAFSPDGTRFAMSSGFYGQAIAIEVRSLVGSGVQKIIDTKGACIVTGWSHDGRYLVVDTQDPKTGFDVQKIDIAARRMTPVVHGPADELAPALSPNGKWLAYVSTEAGAPEIYLTTFPDGAGKWQATPDGGNAPRWSPDGKQLIYAKGDRLMAVAFHESGTMPQFDPPTMLPVKIFSDRIFVSSYSPYAVTADRRLSRRNRPVARRRRFTS